MSTQPTVPAVQSAPPAAAPASVAAPATAPPSSSEGKSINQRVAAAFAAVQPAEGAPNAAPVADPATQGEPAPVAAPEEAPAEVTDPALEGGAPAEGAVTEAEEIDDGSTLGPKSFADWVNQNQAVKDALAKPENAALRSHLFGALRRDEENRELRAFVPDVETAKAMSQSAGNFQTFDNLFVAAQKPENAGAFLDQLAKMAVYVDDQGKPVTDASGRYQYHPALGNIFSQVYQANFNAMREQVQKTGKISGDARSIMTDVLAVFEKQANSQSNNLLLGAVDEIREALNAVSPAQIELSPELKERDAAIRKREEDQTKRESEQHLALHSQSQERSEKSAVTSVEASLKPILDKAGLQGALRATVASQIIEKLDEFVEAQPYYTATTESILSKPPGEEREREYTAHILKYYNQGIRMGKIVAETITDFTQPALKVQADKDAKVNGQKQDSAGDRGSPAAPVTRAGAKTPAEVRADVMKDFPGASPEKIRNEMLKRSLLTAGMPA
jgi:hypothetical protein